MGPRFPASAIGSFCAKLDGPLGLGPLQMVFFDDHALRRVYLDLEQSSDSRLEA